MSEGVGPVPLLEETIRRQISTAEQALGTTNDEGVGLQISDEQRRGCLFNLMGR